MFLRFISANERYLFDERGCICVIIDLSSIKLIVVSSSFVGNFSKTPQNTSSATEILTSISKASEPTIGIFEQHSKNLAVLLVIIYYSVCLYSLRLYSFLNLTLPKKGQITRISLIRHRSSLDNVRLLDSMLELLILRIHWVGASSLKVAIASNFVNDFIRL